MEKPHVPFQDRTSAIGNSLSWEPTLALLKLAIAFLVAGALVSLIALRILVPDEPLRAGGPGLALLVAATGWILLWRGKLKATINVLAFGTWATLTVIAVFTGGVRAPVFMVFPVIILLLGWFASRRDAMIITGLTVATTIFLLIAESKGFLPSPQPSVSALYGIVQVTLSVLSLFLMDRLVHSYKDRLKDLAASRIELSHAQTVGNMGSWVYEMANDTMRLSSEACRMFGLPEGTTESLEHYFARIHEQDRSATAEAWQRGLNGAPFDRELRIRVGESIRWVRQKAVHEPRSDGMPLSTLGIVQDITERKRSEVLVELEHAVTRSLTEVDTSRKVLQTVMRVICESEQWETAGYFRVEDEAGTTKLLVGWRLAGSDAAATEYYRNAANMVVPPGGLLSQVALSGKPLWFANMREQHTTWYKRIERTDEKATFSFPVLVDSKVIGVLAFSSREIREPDERLLATVNAIGKQVGQFMQRKQAEQALRESEARFKTIFNEAPLGIALIDSLTGHIYALNPMFAKIAGRTLEKMVDIDWMIITHPDDVQKDMENIALLNAGKISGFQTEKRYVHPDGTVVWVNMTVAQIYTNDKAHPRHLCMIEDIAERKTAEEQIRQLVYCDTLTNLPNRRMLMDRLNQALSQAKRFGRSLAILFLDLDNFKRINDTLGHDAGDELLKEVAKRLVACVRTGDTVSRQGGDEFIIVLSEITHPDDAANVADKIIKAFQQPVRIGEQNLNVTTSIGISLFPINGHDDAKELLRKADAAMYEAKQAGRNQHRFFDVT